MLEIGRVWRHARLGQFMHRPRNKRVSPTGRPRNSSGGRVTPCKKSKWQLPASVTALAPWSKGSSTTEAVATASSPVSCIQESVTGALATSKWLLPLISTAARSAGRWRKLFLPSPTAPRYSRACCPSRGSWCRWGRFSTAWRHTCRTMPMTRPSGRPTPNRSM